MALRPPQLIGESPLFHALLERLSDLAALDIPVLLTGEPGTGKDIMAARLHFLSPRWEGPYRRINCAACQPEDLASRLFGHIYYDGRPDRDGLITEAEGGTLFLDHIEAMPAWMQEKLADALAQGAFLPMGSDEEVTVETRFLFASDQDLLAATQEGHFSTELLDHIAFEVLHLPPLRSRAEDVAPLAHHFARKMAARLGAEQFSGFTPEGLAFLMEQPWPGNVRELKFSVERSVAHAFLEDESLAEPITALRMTAFRARGDAPPDPVSLPAGDAPPQLDTTDFTERVLRFERGLIDQALDLHHHHQGKAADYLGLTYHQFRGLLRKHGLKK